MTARPGASRPPPCQFARLRAVLPDRPLRWVPVVWLLLRGEGATAIAIAEAPGTGVLAFVPVVVLLWVLDSSHISWVQRRPS